MRAVADANVVVAAALNPSGTPRRAVDFPLERRAIVLSAAIVAEIEDVLARPYITARIATDDRALLLKSLIERAQFAVTRESIDICRDPKDNKYIEAALAAEARFVVTGDKDLLVLDPWREIRFLSPRDFLAKLGD